MIIRTIARRRNILSSVSATRRAARCISQTSTPTPLGSLRKSRVPTLSNNEARLQEEGIPGLFSSDAFRIAWTEYQGMMVEAVDATTAGTPLEGLDPQKLAVQTAREPDLAYTFNCASMAFNNHFFFKGISLDPNPPTPSPELTNALSIQYSSLDSLRSTFLKTASAMFGPGFVWLVQLREERHPFRILCTYNAGSPLPGAHYRAQTVDMNTQNVDSAKNLPPHLSQVQNTAGAFGEAAQRGGTPKQRTSLGGADVTPLLCVNTWEHAWLPDWGIGGKEDYLEAWWERINWNTVLSLAHLMAPMGFQRRFEYGLRR